MLGRFWRASRRLLPHYYLSVRGSAEEAMAGLRTPRRPPWVRLLVALSLILNIVLLLSLSHFIGGREGSGSWSDWSLHRITGDAFHQVGKWQAWDTPSSYGKAKGSWKGRGQRRCGACDVAPELCAEYGEDGLARAMSYMGSGDRIKRFILKAREGNGFTVGVIGGSVSKGFGLDITNTDNLNNPHNVHKVVFHHLDQLFPAPNGYVNGSSGVSQGMNGFVNGALGGTGTDYFSLCFGEHIPDDVDLVLTELSINDELLLKNMDSYELMLRGLLDLPNQPAIINLQVFALMFPTIAQGGDLHMGVAQHYDLPVISLRNLLLPSVLASKSAIRTWFHNKWTWSGSKKAFDDIDFRHISPKGHQLAGELINAYIDTQICELDSYEEIHGPSSTNEFPPAPLPRLLLTEKFDIHKTTPKLHPQCFSTNSNAHALRPFKNDGWRQWNWKEKNYLVADRPGSKISFMIHTALGRVQVAALHSHEYALGSVECWIDNNRRASKRIDGYWDQPYNIGRAETIAENIKPGNHQLSCELLKETNDPGGGREFRLISVMSI